jgi:hypothetical protein
MLKIIYFIFLHFLYNLKIEFRDLAFVSYLNILR